MDTRAAISVISAAIWALVWIAAPDVRPFDVHIIPRDAMVYFPGNLVGQPVPPAEGEAQLGQGTAAAVPVRQLHFSLPTIAGAALYMSASPDDAALWVNGIAVGDGTRSTYFGPGFGPHQFLLEIPQQRLNFESNRVDILTMQGWSAQRQPAIYMFPLRNGPAFAAMVAQADGQLWRGAIMFGAIGLLVSLVGLLLLRSRALYIGGALFSLALIDHAVNILPVWLRLGIAVMGLIMLMVGKVWRYPVLGGAYGAAAIAVVVAGVILSGYDGSMALAWCTNAALWPLGGVAVPLLSLGEGRMVWNDFIAARTKIREQAAVIVQQADALKDGIRATAVAEERQRFVRDMHDGVGGHLLSLLMRVRADDANNADIAKELEKGLTDLRLMADSLDHVGANLDAALMAFHRRAEQQLVSAGLGFAWSKPPVLRDFQMDARAVLSLYRIMQEALTNCIRHAHATQFGVAFDLSVDGAQLDVIIEDDGDGFSIRTIAEGRGLGNIRQRAQKLGGTVEFLSRPDGKGSRINLRVPKIFAG